MQIKDGIVTLRPPNKFMARWLSDHYLGATFRAWQAAVPSITAVLFDECAIRDAALEDEPREIGPVKS